MPTPESGCPAAPAAYTRGASTARTSPAATGLSSTGAVAQTALSPACASAAQLARHFAAASDVWAPCRCLSS